MGALKSLIFSSVMLVLCGTAFADIIYQGKRVQAWPNETITKFDNNRGSKMHFAPVSETSHYSAPKGKIFGLTLLVDFSDSPAPVTVDEVSDWLNKEGFNRNGCNGSVRDYYLDVSNGLLDMTNEVFGWYRAKNPKSYYEGLSGYSGSDVLMKEVFEYFDSMVDYSRFDNDNDGITEAINIVYAGAGQTWGQGLWPHAGWSNELRDGVRLQKHQMTDMTGNFAIYVFVHESGHMIFGWPDLYWYGDYCTMGNRANDINPVAINDFFRADQGWIPFVDVTTEDVGKVSTEAHEKCYRFKNPNRPNEEGLVWSYVTNTGRNKTLKGSGILMQHYDFPINGNSAADKLGLRVVHADAKGKSTDAETEQWPSPGNRAGAFFTGSYNAYSDALYPATRWYSGAATGLNFTDVGVSGNTLTFCLGGSCEEIVESSSSVPASSSSSVEVPMTVTEINLTTELPISDNYATVVVDLQGAKVATALGLKQNEIASVASFYAVEPDGSFNSNATGEGTGHWFDSKGAVTAWDPNGTSVVFSNVDLATMTTKVGHMPNLVKAEDTFAFKQAVVYDNKQVTFNIQVTIVDDDTGSNAISQLHQESLNLHGTSLQYFDMNGNMLKATPTRPGIYLKRTIKNGLTLSLSVVRIR